MASDSAEHVTKTKKPSDSAFKQQRLPAWQPILTAGTVLPTFFVIGIAFIPVGIGLLYFSDEVNEKTVDYTNCTQYNIRYWLDDFDDLKIPCSKIIEKNASEECECRIPFTLDNDFHGKVYMYYGLSNYYQNHRRYVKSRDDHQLLGHLDSPPSSDCMPFDYINNNGTDKEKKKPIAPCGAIANSLFSDELTIYSVTHKDKVPLLRTGIAWPSDRDIKFRNPAVNTALPISDQLKDAFKDYAKPKDWRINVWQLDTDNPGNNGFQNEDLIVWMRTAALPTFRKLYRRVNHDEQGYGDGLMSGDYVLLVKYRYSVSAFDGTKRMILSTTSLLGGKNPFLGIAYIVVGCVCLLLGIALLFIHIKCSRRLTGGATPAVSRSSCNVSCNASTSEASEGIEMEIRSKQMKPELLKLTPLPPAPQK